MNATAIKYPVAIEKLPPKESHMSWLNARLLDIRATTMTQPVKPYWNTTMVTAWVAVIGLVLLLLGSIGGLYVYTKNTYEQSGYERGRRDERDAARDKQIEEIRGAAAKAKDIALGAQSDQQEQGKENKKK